ncbi:MAG TPA: 3' terminal RNA ribose 2'-O-methyltransferase Hen1, partial [Myxococcota bacterium]
MLLTITTTHSPATDLGYLLAKHPARAQRFSLACGAAHVFYPHVADDRCTAALLLDIDVVGLTRRPGRGEQASPLAPYVNDRAYVASSFMSVAIAQVFSSALQGRCRDRQDIADRAIPLVITLDVLPCRGGEAVLRALFEPLGYVVEAQRLPLDARTPAWG